MCTNVSPDAMPSSLFLVGFQVSSGQVSIHSELTLRPFAFAIVTRFSAHAAVLTHPGAVLSQGQGLCDGSGCEARRGTWGICSRGPVRSEGKDCA